MRLPAGAARVRATFSRAHDEGRSALVVYLMAGYPDDGASLAAAEAALSAGADVLEIGVPFSDPVADGPTIAAAGHAAVAAGGGVDSALRLVRDLRAAGHEQPILAMGYLNPLVARGAARTLGELATSGVDALIVPDLPAGEDLQLERLSAHAGLGICFLVTPNTTDARVARAVRASTAFLYIVPLYGVTGARDGVAAATVPLLRRMRAAVDGRLPLAVGFGVSRPDHVRQLAPEVDGIIVGSAVVSALTEGGPAAVGRFVGSLAGAGMVSGGRARPGRRPGARRRAAARRPGGSSARRR